MDKVKQPDWCNYPEADEPFIGCWSLWFGKVTDEDYCKDCECYIKRGIALIEELKKSDT